MDAVQGSFGAQSPKPLVGLVVPAVTNTAQPHDSPLAGLQSHTQHRPARNPQQEGVAGGTLTPRAARGDGVLPAGRGHGRRQAGGWWEQVCVCTEGSGSRIGQVAAAGTGQSPRQERGP